MPSRVNLDLGRGKMKRKKFTEEQIIAILKQADAGILVKDICRQNGISGPTFSRWKAKFGGMDVSDAKRLRSLETENSRLKRLVADLTLDNQILRDVNSKKW